MQSKTHSFVESCTNTASAFFLSWFIQATIVPTVWPQVAISTEDAFWITVMFTVVAILRNYWWRRIFNWMHTKCSS